MSDDLVARAAGLVLGGCAIAITHAPPAMVQGEVATFVGDMAAEIARLRAAINDALTAPFHDPELNATRHQEPIGPNETPEEAIKRLVSVRAEWEVHKNNCENPVIAELRAELDTARRDAMEEAAKLVETHVYTVSNFDPQFRLTPDRRAKDDMHHTTIAAAIRAAAGKVK